MASPSSPSSPLLVAVMALLLLSWAAPSVLATVLCNAGDKKILLSLKQSLGNPAELSSWKEDTNCCATWTGIGCNERGRVSALDIGPINTSGNLPSSISELAELDEIVICMCNLSGPIPDSIGKLRSLTVLKLERNGLTGSIPDSIGQIGSLIILSFSHNKLSGSIPASLGRLHNIEDLYLDANRLSGPVPASFADLDPKLVNISTNNLSGDVSALITGWASANTIDASHNAFHFGLDTVKFPAGLETLDLSDNQIYGTIPPSADGMKGLKQFDVSRNGLCGKIPQGGVVSRFPSSSFAGNKCLCDSPMPWCPVLNCPLFCNIVGGVGGPSSLSSLVELSR